MHRSGTLALTRALGLLGLGTGSGGALMGASPSNESGHWEITALTECNDRLLALAGGRWSAPPHEEVRFADLATEPIGDVARSLVAETLPASPWAWKDPRLCLTLAFWKAVLPATPAMVVSLRNPLEVAASLHRRNGFSTEYGHAVWERYLRSLWRELEGSAVIVVDYRDLVSEAGRVIDDLAAFVEGHSGVAPSGAAQAEAAASLDGRLRHHVADRTEVATDPAMAPTQRALFEQSLALVGTHASLPAVPLGSETPGLQLAFDEHTRMAAYEDESYRLRAGIEEVRSEARASLDRHTLFFHQELERRSAEASVLATDVMAARERLAALQGTLDRIRRRPPVRLYLAARRRLPGRG